MFEMGFMELVLVAVIGLLVLGPQRLPKVAAELGKWIGRARRTATQLRRQLEREIELNELQTPPPQPPPAPKPSSAAGPPPPAAPSAVPYGEVPPGPGTHADRPPPGEAEPPAPASTPERRVEQTPPS